MALIEYLYVDRVRLDSYFEQISSPNTSDKLPEWKAELNLTGGTVGGTQKSLPRPFTNHEKVTRLQAYLEGRFEFQRGRPCSQHDDPPRFRLEVCQAERIHIPPPAGAPLARSLNFWLSEPPSIVVDKLDATAPSPDDFRTFQSSMDTLRKKQVSLQPGRLYLMEDMMSSDGYPGGTSSFSGLKALLDIEHQVEHRPNVAALEYLPNSWLGGPMPEIRLLETDTRRFLQAVGAIRSGVRTIETLYRVRERFLDADLPALTPSPVEGAPAVPPLTTVGYPIFIAAVAVLGR